MQGATTKIIIAMFREKAVIWNVDNNLPSDIRKDLRLLQDRCENLKSRKLLVTSWSELRRRIGFILCEEFCWIQTAQDRVKRRR